MERRIRAFESALAFLPGKLRESAASLPDNEKADACELRLRAGRGFSVYINREEKLLSEDVGAKELCDVLELATESSLHSSRTSMAEGFVTVRGGHRIGLCGTVLRKGDDITGIRELSSLSVRIAREIPDAAKALEREVIKDGRFRNTLIISPPGCGKTTVLRDLVRRLSDGGKRISLVDERSELAAKYRGVPQLDVGRCTDVLDGTDKARGIMMLLRAMSPDIIALDEITDESDAAALEETLGCGAGIVATVHGGGTEILKRRRVLRRLCESGAFEVAAVLSRNGSRFLQRTEEIGKEW